MPSMQQSNARTIAGALPKSPKSPILAAIAISLAVAAGTVLGTLDAATVEDFLSGKWITRSLAETQERNTHAIASLETAVGAVIRDIDFVASRIGASTRRGEEQVSDRFAHLDAEIAALKERVASVQPIRFSPPRFSDALLGGIAGNADLDGTGEVSGLRASLHDLAAAHNGAVAAITRRLDRIEVAVGLSTDVTSSVADPLRRQHARRRALAARVMKKRNIAPASPPQIEATAERSFRPERGHPFGIKPISSRGAPLRLSRLPG